PRVRSWLALCPPGDRDLAALGDRLGDGGEEGVEHARHGGLALPGRAGDARDEFGLGDGLVGHVDCPPKGARSPPFRCMDRATDAPRLVGSTASNVPDIACESADFCGFSTFASACRESGVT